MASWSTAARIAPSLPEAEPGEAHEGSPAVFVRGRQFGRLRRSEDGSDLLQVWVAEPELVRGYVDEDPSTFHGAAGYSRKVVMARLDRLDEEMLGELLVESWRCRARAGIRRAHPDVDEAFPTRRPGGDA